MANYADQLREYFRMTPKSILEEEWNRIHSKFCFGPETANYMEETQMLIDSISLGTISETRIKTESKNSFDKTDSDFCLAA